MPFLAFSRTQIVQLRWISPLDWHTIVEIVLEQYFDRSVPFAILAGVVLAASIVLSRSGIGPSDVEYRRLAVITVAWMALPTTVLLVYSLWLEPIYHPRYLCYTSPAMALLLGGSVVAVAHTRERIAALLAAFALAATPNYLFQQRGPYAKEGMDYSHVADVVSEHAAPGDCLIMDNTITWRPGPIRALTAARPSAYEKLVDPGRGQRAGSRNRLWDAHLGIWGVADRVRQCTVLWTVSQRDNTLPDHDNGPSLPPGPRLSKAPAYQVPQATRLSHRRTLAVQLRAGDQVDPIMGIRWVWRYPAPGISSPDTQDLTDLAAAAQGCRGCDLYRDATQAVFGAGSPKAVLMLVGEQPGDQEDRAGAPFVGPAGKLLDKALAAAEIDRDRLYVTNAVKHFKFTLPERGKRRIHKTPSRTEVVACRPWLVAELMSVRPDVVVLLGATAAQSLMGSAFRLTAHRGEVLHLPVDATPRPRYRPRIGRHRASVGGTARTARRPRRRRSTHSFPI